MLLLCRRHCCRVLYLLLTVSDSWAFQSRGGAGTVATANGNNKPAISAASDSTTHTDSQTPHTLEVSEAFLLPIFPLRKRVRFPTDTLMLNLYEERYLAMSEFILAAENDFAPQMEYQTPE